MAPLPAGPRKWMPYRTVADVGSEALLGTPLAAYRGLLPADTQINASTNPPRVRIPAAWDLLLRLSRSARTDEALATFRTARRRRNSVRFGSATASIWTPSAASRTTFGATASGSNSSLIHTHALAGATRTSASTAVEEGDVRQFAATVQVNVTRNTTVDEILEATARELGIQVFALCLLQRPLVKAGDDTSNAPTTLRLMDDEATVEESALFLNRPRVELAALPSESQILRLLGMRRKAKATPSSTAMGQTVNDLHSATARTSGAASALDTTAFTVANDTSIISDAGDAAHRSPAPIAKMELPTLDAGLLRRAREALRAVSMPVVRAIVAKEVAKKRYGDFEFIGKPIEDKDIADILDAAVSYIEERIANGEYAVARPRRDSCGPTLGPRVDILEVSSTGRPIVRAADTATSNTTDYTAFFKHKRAESAPATGRLSRIDELKLGIGRAAQVVLDQADQARKGISPVMQAPEGPAPANPANDGVPTPAATSGGRLSRMKTKAMDAARKAGNSMKRLVSKSRGPSATPEAPAAHSASTSSTASSAKPIKTIRLDTPAARDLAQSLSPASHARKTSAGPKRIRITSPETHDLLIRSRPPVLRTQTAMTHDIPDTPGSGRVAAMETAVSPGSQASALSDEFAITETAAQNDTLSSHGSADAGLDDTQPSFVSEENIDLMSTNELIRKAAGQPLEAPLEPIDESVIDRADEYEALAAQAYAESTHSRRGSKTFAAPAAESPAASPAKSQRSMDESYGSHDDLEGSAETSATAPLSPASPSPKQASRPHSQSENPEPKTISAPASRRSTGENAQQLVVPDRQSPPAAASKETPLSDQNEWDRDSAGWNSQHSYRSSGFNASIATSAAVPEPQARAAPVIAPITAQVAAPSATIADDFDDDDDESVDLDNTSSSAEEHVEPPRRSIHGSMTGAPEPRRASSVVAAYSPSLGASSAPVATENKRPSLSSIGSSGSLDGLGQRRPSLENIVNTQKRENSPSLGLANFGERPSLDGLGSLGSSLLGGRRPSLTPSSPLLTSPAPPQSHTGFGVVQQQSSPNGGAGDLMDDSESDDEPPRANRSARGSPTSNSARAALSNSSPGDGNGSMQLPSAPTSQYVASSSMSAGATRDQASPSLLGGPRPPGGIPALGPNLARSLGMPGPSMAALTGKAPAQKQYGMSSSEDDDDDSEDEDTEDHSESDDSSGSDAPPSLSPPNRKYPPGAMGRPQAPMSLGTFGPALGGGAPRRSLPPGISAPGAGVVMRPGVMMGGPPFGMPGFQPPKK
jgi:hypothetical protein